MCPQGLGGLEAHWLHISSGLHHGNASELVVLHHAKQNPGVFLDVFLQVFGELLIAFGGDHRQRVDLETAQPLTLLVHAQPQASANRLPAPTLGFTG